MSYAPGFAPDARSQWQALEPRFQEIVLDILDDLTLNPPAKNEHVEDRVIDEGSLRHIIFVHVFVSRQHETITVIGVGHVSRPRDA